MHPDILLVLLQLLFQLIIIPIPGPVLQPGKLLLDKEGGLLKHLQKIGFAGLVLVDRGDLIGEELSLGLFPNKHLHVVDDLLDESLTKGALRAH
jgi:hypothetical protein